MQHIGHSNAMIKRDMLPIKENHWSPAIPGRLVWQAGGHYAVGELATRARCCSPGRMCSLWTFVPSYTRLWNLGRDGLRLPPPPPPFNAVGSLDPLLRSRYKLLWRNPGLITGGYEGVLEMAGFRGVGLWKENSTQVWPHPRPPWYNYKQWMPTSNVATGVYQDDYICVGITICLRK